MTEITKMQFYDSIYKKNGLKAWPGSAEECQLTLKYICYYCNLNLFFEDLDFSENLKSRAKKQNWTFRDFALSALIYDFETNSENNNLQWYSWFNLTMFLMHLETSDMILLILEKNNLNKIVLKDNIIEGILWAFKYRKFCYANFNCVMNLLVFLEIDGLIVFRLLTLYEETNLTIINEFILKNQTTILAEKE